MPKVASIGSSRFKLQLLADIFLETPGTLRNAGKWPCGVGQGVGCNLNNAPNL